MRVLVLTWEFPPFITGGLGMACYGLVKAMLQQGTEVDLFLPTKEDVYFPLRKVEDVDTLPIHHFDEGKKIEFEKRSFSTIEERLTAIGLTAFPESYLTPGFSVENTFEWMEYLQTENITKSVYKIRDFLQGDESLFKKVREFTSRISRHAGKLGFDLIHANDWLTYPSGMLAKKITGKPFIAHIHATEFDRAGGPGDNRIHNIEYLGLSRADRVIAVSQYTANMIFDRYRISPKKTTIIHNAYSVSDGEITRTKIFKDPLVLFLGRVTIQKGPDYFMQVAERVLREHKDVRFVMAGTGDMFSQLLKSSASKRLKDRVLFAGFLNREQVEHILSATDIFVMPSVSEPFGIVPLEAMAFGSAAIISKQSGVVEVIKNAYKFDFWDIDKTSATILELLRDPKKCRKLAKAGRQEVLTIGWQEAAEKTNNLYKETICST